MYILSWGVILLLSSPAAVIAIGEERWPFELAHNILGHLPIISLTVFACLLALRCIGPGIAAGFLTVIYVAPVAMTPGALFSGKAEATYPPAGRGLNIVSFNLLADQAVREPTLAWLRSGPADVLVLVEPSAAWQTELETLRSIYPYQILGLPRNATPGPRWVGRADSDLDKARAPHEKEHADWRSIAVLSRIPLENVRVIYPIGLIRPAVTVTLETVGKPLTLVAVHPAPPTTQEQLNERNQYFTWLASKLTQVEGPLIVAGDFNATPFTPAFKRFRARLGLDLPHYAPATYPAFAGPLGIAIDHILTRGLRFERIEALPSRGSDHRGLFAQIVI